MFKTLGIAALAALGAMASPATAEQIAIQVGYSPGGSYDEVARLVATHIGKHLPGNPTVVVENVPGAGSLKLAKMFMQSDLTDGSQLASVSSALALMPIFDPENTDFDPRKVHYIAAMTKDASYCIAHKSSGIETMDQFLASDAKVGSTGKSSTTYTYPAAIKSAFGATFQIVTGFEGGDEIDLALERGDVQVRCGISAVSLYSGGLLERVNVLAELAPEPVGALENVEFLLDKLEDPKTRAGLQLVFSSGLIHHPLIAAPDTAPEVVEALRTAVMALATDPEFMAEAEARKMTLSITGGAEVEAIIAGFLASDPELQQLARDMVQ